MGTGQHQPVEESQRWLPGQWFGDTSAATQCGCDGVNRLACKVLMRDLLPKKAG